MAGIGASALVALGAAGGCGGARQDANEPSGNFPVQVVRATFPTPQRLAQTSQLPVSQRRKRACTQTYAPSARRNR